MKKILLSILVFSVALGASFVLYPTKISAHEEVNADSLCSVDVGVHSQNLYSSKTNRNDIGSGTESYQASNLDSDKTVEEIERIFNDEIYKYDFRGQLVSIDIDKLEETFGVTEDSIELRRLIELHQEDGQPLTPKEEGPSFNPMMRSLSAGDHILRFGKCVLKQVATSFGFGVSLFIAHDAVIELFGRKAYYAGVQKMAQIAVNKLGKKAAAKLVQAATPAGWAITATKVALWTYRCTVEYGKWA